MYEKGLCVICAMPARIHLCKKHRKYYSYDKRYGVFRLRPRIRVSRRQEILFKNIRAIFKKPTIQEVTFDFFLYARYDIVVVPEKLIIEFDGEQHFRYVPHFHKTKQGFEDYKEKDERKQKVAEANGWHVARFSFVEDVGDREYVRKVLPLK